jgi:DNA gyrase subunit A
MSRTARGKSAINILDLDDGEEITAVVNTDDIEMEDGDADRYLTMVTRDGYIKRTGVEDFQNIHTAGIRAIRLEDGDELVDVEVTDGDRSLVVTTTGGMSIRFAEGDVRAMGRSARGVRGIDLQGDDTVAGVAAVDTDRHSWVLTVTANGYGKRSDIEDYRVQSRNGKGLIDIKTDDRNGSVCAMETVGPGDHLVVMSKSGQIMRTPVQDISTVGRNTKGVIVMDLDADDSVACLDVIPREKVTDESEADVDIDTGAEAAPSDD